MEVAVNVATMDEVRLKDVVKVAILEAFEERREWLTNLVSEAVSDIALGYAIKVGERTPLVSREEVFKTLETA